MKRKVRHSLTFILVLCLVTKQSASQTFSDHLHDFITDEQNLLSAGIKNTVAVRNFYTYLGFKTAWFEKENKNNPDDLLQLVNHSAELGLDKNDYQHAYLISKQSGLNTLEDSLQAEIQLTSIALHYLKDLKYGNTAPALGFNGLDYTPDYEDISLLLVNYLSKHELVSIIDSANHGLPEIAALSKKLAWMLTVLSANNFKEAGIVSTTTPLNNADLLTKLYQLGISDTLNQNMPDTLVKEKIKEAQRQFSVNDDGTLHAAIIRELNVPVSVRVQQIKLAINYYRWLNCLSRDEYVVVVNIPAACLKVYKQHKVIIEMRMIVGKRSTPTPMLASRITEVILYPYWNVPHSIATKELLPAIKKNPGFIDAGNFQVLDKSGKKIDPASVNWQELTTKNFPYTIRQSTGCDNALGLLKLNFYNPYGVYLHDTPDKRLFKMNKRFFSHGCMRMENPFELGHLVLKNNPIAIDTLSQKGCLRNQSPITVPADEKMPVVVWYNPAGVDSTGRVLFFEDIYRKFDWIKR